MHQNVIIYSYPNVDGGLDKLPMNLLIQAKISIQV